MIHHRHQQATREIALSLIDDVRRPVRTASVAELAWQRPDRRPDALPVTPLILGDQPAFAYPYAYADLAREVAASPVVAIVLSDTRMAGSGWRALVAAGRPRLVEDRDGSMFADRLLREELRKYPPSRALADSLLLQREHWWYLPRLVVAITVETIVPVAPRADGAGQVLVVDTGASGSVGRAGLYVNTVRVHDDGPDRVRVEALDGRQVPDGKAVLLGHDFSIPDLERWTPWRTRGVISGGLVTVAEHPERTTLEPALKLRQRFHLQRELGRACRAALDQRAAR